MLVTAAAADFSGLQSGSCMIHKIHNIQPNEVGKNGPGGSLHSDFIGIALQGHVGYESVFSSCALAVLRHKDVILVQQLVT